jgi:glycyl-tRNA synthetase
MTKLTFQDTVQRLMQYWSSKGCTLWFPFHEKVGAGTNNPATVLRVLGSEPLRIAYVEPSFRPDDGRFAENPNRVQMHHQFQVILKPIPFAVQEYYLESLEFIGINTKNNDIRFIEDNWESPVIGAWGLGWEVWLNGLEITQYTYFQQAGGLSLHPAACELTYGLERIVMNLQGVKSLWDIQWNDHHTYSELLQYQEQSYCEYNFNHASIERLNLMFNCAEEEALHALKQELPLPAYDYVCQCSHLFNLLDTRGAVGVAERAHYFARIRAMSKQVAEQFVEVREKSPQITSKFDDWLAPKHEYNKKLINQKDYDNCLLEFGFEELASFVPPRIIPQIEEALPAILKKFRLQFDSIVVWATPRRIVIKINNLAYKQKSEILRVKGPNKEICDKNPVALNGFLRKNGVSLEDVKFIDEGTISYAFIERLLDTEDLSTIMPEIVKELFLALQPGRSMRWIPNDPNITFNRPLRWIVCLFGDTVISVSFAGIQSSNYSFGGRWESSPKLFITSADEYESIMLNNNIIVDQAKRKDHILNSTQDLAKLNNGNVFINETLLEELNYIVENPVPFLGSLGELVDELPGFVIDAVIEKHIRCLTIKNLNNEYTSKFIGISNGLENYLSNVKSGFEQVALARLKDARFFISRDRVNTLFHFYGKLNNLIFHDLLGTMLNKSNRVESLSNSVVLNTDCSRDILVKAARLSKADLTTQMVTEMTKLQGFIGEYYLNLDGEDPRVGKAINDHYYPRFFGDRLGTSIEGKVLGILHRIDTLVGFFGLGAEPTGSADPFGLRREAVGAIVLLSQDEMSSLELTNLITMSYQEYLAQDVKLTRDLESTLLALKEFIYSRAENYFREKGFRYDIVRSVLSVQLSNLAYATKCLDFISAEVAKSDFIEWYQQYSRCFRLVTKVKNEGEQIEEFSSLSYIPKIGEEIKLLELINKLGNSESLEQAILHLKELSPVIADYFNVVMVMSDDLNERNFRLSLLNKIVIKLTPYLDLTKIEI